MEKQVMAVEGEESGGGKWSLAVVVFSFFAASVVYNVSISLSFLLLISSPLIVPSS